ncbi:MAG TPA: hypothetical protein VK586_11900, partial [Streptosporangiaceae bacterium]|nr:hypothetical protein [Streptosporangiaceae bacterium]
RDFREDVDRYVRVRLAGKGEAEHTPGNLIDPKELAEIAAAAREAVIATVGRLDPRPFPPLVPDLPARDGQPARPGNIHDLFGARNGAIQSWSRDQLLSAAREELGRLPFEGSSRAVRATMAAHHAQARSGPGSPIVAQVMEELLGEQDFFDQVLAMWRGVPANSVNRQIYLDYFLEKTDEGNQRKRWQYFWILIHEYFHLIEHPEYLRRRMAFGYGSAPEHTMREGTVSRLELIVHRAIARHVQDPALRARIEGKYARLAPLSAAKMPLPVPYPADAQAMDVISRVGLYAMLSAFLRGDVAKILGPDRPAQTLPARTLPARTRPAQTPPRPSPQTTAQPGAGGGAPVAGEGSQGPAGGGGPGLGRHMALAPFDPDRFGAGAGYGLPSGPQVRLRGGADRASRAGGGRAGRDVTGRGGPSRQAGAAAGPAAAAGEQYGVAADNEALGAIRGPALAALLGTGVQVARLPEESRPRDPALDWVSLVQGAASLAAGSLPARQVIAQVTEEALIRALPQVLAGGTVQLHVQAGGQRVAVPLSAGQLDQGGIGAAEAPAGAPAGLHWRWLTLNVGGQPVTAPLPLVARGPVTRPVTRPGIRPGVRPGISPGGRKSGSTVTVAGVAGTVHRADLADGVADRLFGQVAGTGVSRTGFDAALAGLGGHLGQAAGGGWLAQAGGRAFLVHAAVWRGYLRAVARTPAGPRYVYELGLNLGAAAGDPRDAPDLPARAGWPDDATAVVTVTPLEAWRMGLELPDAGEDDAPPVPPPDADSPLSLGLFGAASMVRAGGRGRLVRGVLEAAAKLRADLPPATRDGLPPATLNGPVSPAQADSLAAVLDAFSDMTDAAADALSGPLTFSLPGTRGEGADPVEIEVHAGTNYRAPDTASTANFAHEGSFRLDGAVYHLYTAAMDYTITARSARLGVDDRAARLAEQSLDPPAGITAPGPVVGAIRVEDGALWAVRHSDLAADGVEPPPPGDLSEMFLAEPDDDSLLPLPQHRVSADDLGDFTVLDVAYSEYHLHAARVVLAKEIRWNQGLSAFDAPGRPDDPRPGPKWGIAKDLKSWTSV